MTFRLPEFAQVPEGMIPCREVLVATRDLSVAENVQQLIHGGILLRSADNHDNPWPRMPIPTDQLGDLANTEPFCNAFYHSPDVQFGCKVAQSAWNNRHTIYAIEKLKLSWKLDWYTPWSAAPSHGQIFGNEHPEFYYHTNAAFAIIAAFSAIEEIGLEIRASAERPRFIGGDWNPKVRNLQAFEDRRDNLRRLSEQTELSSGPRTAFRPRRDHSHLPVVAPAHDRYALPKGSQPASRAGIPPRCKTNCSTGYRWWRSAYHRLMAVIPSGSRSARMCQDCISCCADSPQLQTDYAFDRGRIVTTTMVENVQGHKTYRDTAHWRGPGRAPPLATPRKFDPARLEVMFPGRNACIVRIQPQNPSNKVVK